MLVVIVEDDADVALLEAEVLRPVAATVTVLDGFAEALAEVPWNRVDAAVVDLMVPGFDSAEFLRWLGDEHPNVRRVVVSAAAVSMLNEVAPHAEVVLTKPFDVGELRAAVRG